MPMVGVKYEIQQVLRGNEQTELCPIPYLRAKAMIVVTMQKMQ
jgi:hypothetical protein